MVTKGKCAYCLSSFSGNMMGKHLLSCRSRQDFIKEFEDKPPKDAKTSLKKYNEVTFYLLKIFSPGQPEYWLYIDLSDNLTLLDLDSFLRNTWLECCGHLSSFTIDDQTYEYQLDKLFDNDSKSMRIKLKKLLYKGMSIGYIYDYGSSTEIEIKVISSHSDITKNSSKFIKISARNDDIDFRCIKCKKEKATEICTICLYEKEGGRTQSSFCKSCGMKHDCGEEMTLPIVNSPRSGICGYTGEF